MSVTHGLKNIVIDCADIGGKITDPLLGSTRGDYNFFQRIRQGSNAGETTGKNEDKTSHTYFFKGIRGKDFIQLVKIRQSPEIEQRIKNPAREEDYDRWTPVWDRKSLVIDKWRCFK